jgi:hypothetical protein
MKVYVFISDRFLISLVRKFGTIHVADNAVVNWTVEITPVPRSAMWSLMPPTIYRYNTQNSTGNKQIWLLMFIFLAEVWYSVSSPYFVIITTFMEQSVYVTNFRCVFSEAVIVRSVSWAVRFPAPRAAPTPVQPWSVTPAPVHPVTRCYAWDVTVRWVFSTSAVTSG